MAHRLLHSLVFSSVMLLEGVACSISHRPEPVPPPPEPDAGPGGDGGPPPDDAAPSDAGGGWLDDAGQLRDAEAFVDAWRADAGRPDAGRTDAGPDPATRDAAVEPDAGEPFCEPGWPPTKGFWCVLEDDVVRCCGSRFEEGVDCCVVEPEETP